MLYSTYLVCYVRDVQGYKYLMQHYDYMSMVFGSLWGCLWYGLQERTPQSNDIHQ